MHTIALKDGHMRLGDLLNKLGWAQADLARHAEISTTTVRRVFLQKSISRRNAQKIVDSLSTALRIPLETTDINELHISDFQRPDRQKIPRPPT
jgi:ribosome-binding protein aMBF1 (putative translation factor)